jgi:AcrR family transcriptional regulator
MTATDKKLHILEVAERLIADHGFDGTSVRDIAKEADVNVAMISYYFGSKEKLLEALFEMRSQEVTLKIEHLIQDETMTSLDKIQRLVDSYLDKMTNQPCFHRIMIRQQADDKDGLISRQIFTVKMRNQQLIKKLVQHGQKKGDFKKNIDVPMVMGTLFGTVNQMISTQHFYRAINNLQDMSEEEFQKYLKKKLSHHLKSLFKLLLTHED